MSRYYRIELQDPDGDPIKLDSFGNFSGPLPLQQGQALESGVITSLLPDGRTNPAALNVELDIEQVALHSGDMKSYVRIYGLALSDIFRRDLNPRKDGKANKIKISVGMAKGLPLADPRQQGVVVDATIYQAFGNWLGTDMTLDLVLGPGGLGSPDDPKNYVFNWERGKPLSDAIKETLKNSPQSGLEQQITISDDRVGTEDHTPGYYGTLTQFAQAIQDMTAHQRGKDDRGVYIYLNGQKIIVGDTSISSDMQAKTINFQDLIGQVTWYAPTELTCKLVMRGDLDLLNLVTFPQGANVLTTSNAMPGLAQPPDKNSVGIASGGTFKVMRIHHWGNYRAADALAWNTTLGLVPNDLAL